MGRRVTGTEQSGVDFPVLRKWETRQEPGVHVRGIRLCPVLAVEDVTGDPLRHEGARGEDQRRDLNTTPTDVVVEADELDVFGRREMDEPSSALNVVDTPVRSNPTQHSCPPQYSEDSRRYGPGNIEGRCGCFLPVREFIVQAQGGDGL